MEEIAELGDVVTVLRDGAWVATVPAGTDESRLIELMSGRTLADLYPAPRTELGAVRLEIRGLSTVGKELDDINLEVRAGEIVGVGGLVGCGKSELGQACFGLLEATRGSIAVDGKAMCFRHPAQAIEAGVWYSPPDRKRDGLSMMRPASENMLLSSLAFGPGRSRLLRRKAEAETSRRLSSKVDFPAGRLGEAVENFSGGNQQKVLLAKGLGQEIDVYIFDEPTVGVDVGARAAVYRYIAELSASGAAVLLISSDLPELLGLSNRLLVMRNGRLVAQFDRAGYEQHLILEQFFE